MTDTKKFETAVFGGGCFWCTEAVFKMFFGVQAVTSGYAGGKTEHPTYEDVSSGRTGHAEVVRVDYDTAKVSYETLLTVFFASHDPTTQNRQGEDVGTQYRSIILYTTEEQKQATEKFIANLNASSELGGKITTEVRPLQKFFEAEEYHRDYYVRNGSAPYCQAVINPKLKKVQEKFADFLKTAGTNW